MSKIYFSTSEKEKFKRYISSGYDNYNIELIKKHHEYKDILLKYTNISKVLINIIFEYTHEIILISGRGTHINLSDNVEIRIEKVELEHKYNIFMMNNINLLFKFNSIELNRGSYQYSPELILNSKVCSHNSYLFNLEHFINYYMKTYYNKQTPYIKHLEYKNDERHGIHKNIYFSSWLGYGHMRPYYTHDFYDIIQMLDHKKIKRMIVIVKLFVKLLYNYQHS